MSDIAISLKGISKHYKLYNEPKDRLKEALHPLKQKYHHPFFAIKNLNLDIKKGDVLGIVGRNGCGKSTLLKIIAGVLQPNEGNLSVNGKITALLELGAGFNPEFTGIENINFYAKVLGLSDAELEKSLPSIVQFCELGLFLNQPVKTYSSGMKARLGFAVAAHIDPEILILDEVLAVGDALFRRKCYAKMEEFFKAGKTIIYVSHNANSINQLCNRAILLHEGQMIMDGDPKEVTKHYEKLLFSDTPDQFAKTIAQPQQRNNSANKRPEKRKKHKKSGENYIEGLVSKSIMSYGDERAEITDILIETMEGDKVNVLYTGKQYSLKYRVNFYADIENISYGIKFKTEKGVETTGAATHKQDHLYSAACDEKIEVSWIFTCNFLQGTYYLNIGVSEHLGGEKVYLQRLVDAFVFKVKPTEHIIDKGQVYLELACSDVSTC